jgi:hypothetical protein
MTDTPTTFTLPTTDDPKPWREHAEKMTNLAKEYRSQLVAAELRNIGLEPDKGLGKALLSVFPADRNPTELGAYAKEEYGHEYTPPPPADPATAPPAESSSEEDPTAEAKARALADQQAAVNATMAASTSVVDVTAAERLRSFEERAGKGEATREEAIASIDDALAQLR